MYPNLDNPLFSESILKWLYGFEQKGVQRRFFSKKLDDATNLGQIFVNGIEPYVETLAKDADLVLEVGERVLDHAVANDGYHKKVRVYR